MNADQNRDRLLEEALKHELGAAALAPQTEGCLDAETVAAWTDGGLDAQGVALAEAHVSNCTRCQTLVGALAHTIPAAAVTTSETGARLWRWWFAPLAAGAAAVTLWMVVPQEQYSAPPSAPATEVAQAPPSPTSAPPATAPAESKATVGDGKKDRANVTQATQPARARDQAAPERQAFSKLKREAEAPKELGKLAAEGARAEARTDKAAAAEVTVTGRDARAMSPAPPAAVSQATPQPSDLIRVTARSSPSRDVIWFAGRGGLVLRATDGQTFLRVPFPETADLTAIAATDAQNAVVTTAEGRTFETRDGGKTWRQL